MCFYSNKKMYTIFENLMCQPMQVLPGFIVYHKRTSGESLPLKMVTLFINVLKRKYLRIHSAFRKIMQNIIVFTYRLTSSNTFISAKKGSNVLLSRSLGMLGFKKKKKKMQSHSNYLLGTDFVTKFHKLNFTSRFKRIMIRFIGIKRFVRASYSKLRNHLKYLGRMLKKKTNAYKRWFWKKNSIMRKCYIQKKTYRITPVQRRKEAYVKRGRIRAIIKYLRIGSILFFSKIPFGGHNFGKKKVFERYIYKKFY